MRSTYLLTLEVSYDADDDDAAAAVAAVVVGSLHAYPAVKQVTAAEPEHYDDGS